MGRAGAILRFVSHPRPAHVIFALTLWLAISFSGLIAAQAATTQTSLSWSTALVHGIDGLALACPSPTFCVVGGAESSVLTYNGKTWSKPDPVDPPTNLNARPRIDSISCPSPSFCAAGDELGTVLTYKDNAWSKPQQLDTNGIEPGGKSCRGYCPEMTVSCPSVNFCMAVGVDGYVATYNGTTWSPKTPLSDAGLSYNNLVFNVVCLAKSWCLATASNGNYYTYNGAWSPVFSDPAGGTVDALTCLKPRLCVAVDGRSAEIYKNGSWSGPGELIPSNADSRFWSVSCPSAAYCVGGDTNDDAITFDPTTSTVIETQPLIPSPVGPGDDYTLTIACASSSFCGAADNYGHGFIGEGPSTSATRS